MPLSSVHHPESLCRRHYENFPVASLLLPRRARRAVAAIYAFARSADDIADEGELSAAERLAGLDAYERQLDVLARGERDDHPLFNRLGEAVRRHRLDIHLLRDLLSAFRQDVTQTHYRDHAEIAEYCRRSANPVGRLLLQIFDQDTPRHQTWSDAVCSALQLINFLQDVRSDYGRGRIYLAQDRMSHHGVSEQHIRDARADAAWQALIAEEIGRARALLRSGAPLARALPGRFGLELRLIVAGGLTVLDKLERQNRDRFAGGARLGALDWLLLPVRALRLPSPSPDARSRHPS